MAFEGGMRSEDDDEGLLYSTLLCCLLLLRYRKRSFARTVSWSVRWLACLLRRARFDRSQGLSLVTKQSLGCLHVTAGGTLTIGCSRTLCAVVASNWFRNSQAVTNLADPLSVSVLRDSKFRVSHSMFWRGRLALIAGLLWKIEDGVWSKPVVE